MAQTLIPLDSPAESLTYISVNGDIYFPDVVLPGNTGRTCTFNPPTEIVWNPDSDPLISDLTSNDDVHYRYKKWV